MLQWALTFGEDNIDIVILLFNLGDTDIALLQ